MKKFVEDVKSTLWDDYTLSNGTVVKGQAISYVITTLREKGWRSIGRQDQFENYLEQSGFRLVHGKNRRGNRALVVTV